MKSKKTTAAKDTTVSTSGALFDRTNIIWMLIGAAAMIVGYLLMAGGRSDDPNVFNADEVYSTTRITIAPILILAGFVIEIVAIFRNPKAGVTPTNSFA